MLGLSPVLPLPAPPCDGNLGPLPVSQITELQNEETVKNQDKPIPTPASVATHTKTIGIIHPPTDIRNIVDKTVQFVAKNGPEFEKRIVANNAGNPKFNFLNSSDPYHAYYQHRLTEFRAQTQNLTLQPSDSFELDSLPSDTLVDGIEVPEKPDVSAQFKPVHKILVPPEAEQYTVRLPEGITGEELDIIKLTAQFVARNGKSFLTGLTSREINNVQFHFLKPTHSMFMFFTALCDAYSKVLMPPKGLVDKLRRSVTDMTTVLERCLDRLEWERSQEQARQKAEDEIEQERMQMAMIDWHDFVVVESIDFADDEDEDLPAPMTLDEVIRRSKVSAMEVEDEITVEPGKEIEMEMDEEEVHLIEEGMKASHLEENGHDSKTNEARANLNEPEQPMRIVKNWKRPENRVMDEWDSTKYVVSPITGELIPISEMSEHMRISLIDPKFKEQKERMFAKIRDTTLAQDDEISKNIVGLARTRPDIFGTTEEEVSNAVKAEIEKKKDEQPMQVIWDGHSGSIGRTANQAMTQSMAGTEQKDPSSYDLWNLPGPAIAPANPGIPSIRPLPLPPGLALNIPRPVQNPLQYPPRPQLISMIPPVRPPLPPNQMPIPGGAPNIPGPLPPGSHLMPMPPQHRPFTLVPPPPPPMHLGVPLPPPEEAPPPPPDDEPDLKKPRLNDLLIPEDVFLAQNPGPVRITVSVPNVDEGILKGQILEITVISLSETVGSLKEKIAGEVQLPANKQKLSGKAGFLKDNMSLAHYNVGFGETLTLALRERGGRKR